MMNTLLIIWSMLATVVVFLIGLTLTFSRYGDARPGATLAVLAVAMAAACVQQARKQWGWRRQRYVYAPPVSVKQPKPTTRRRIPAAAAEDAEPRSRRRKAEPTHA